MSRQSIQQHLQQQQQQQQQQLLNAKPQLQQIPLQFQQQNLRSFVKQYELGMCVRRLTHYMYQLRHRPKDNNIEFWREFVAEYFAPHAKKKWCVSTHESGQNIGVFQKDALHCEICNSNPGRGLEATVEVLPRLFKIQYECGTLEELLFVDVPHEYQNLNGQIIVEYATAIQESVFDDLRVVCNGQLRVVFSPDLKICSWEFCARNYEELIPRCSVVAQVKQIRAAAQDYQTTTDNALSNVSVQELQNSYNTLVASARQAAEAVGVPQVNALGHKRRYTRCLRIADVVSSMKDLIDYSLETGTGPMETFSKFPWRTNPSSASQQSELQQHSMVQNSISDEGSIHLGSMQVVASNDMARIDNSINSVSASTSSSAIFGLLYQNSINSKQKSSLNKNASRPYGGKSLQVPSSGSSSMSLCVQPDPCPRQSPMPTSSDHSQQTSIGGMPAANLIGSANLSSRMPLQQPALSGDADHSDSQSFVQKLIHKMMHIQLNGTGSKVCVGSLGNEVNVMNGFCK